MFAQLKEKTVWTAIVRLGVFFFVFLGLEYLFDNLMAAVTDSTGVVRAQSYVLGVSAMGFLAYGMLPERIRNAGHRRYRVFYSQHTLADFKKKCPILRVNALVRKKMIFSPLRLLPTVRNARELSERTNRTAIKHNNRKSP